LSWQEIKNETTALVQNGGPACQRGCPAGRRGLFCGHRNDRDHIEMILIRTRDFAP
jgi:hypothetical protein